VTREEGRNRELLARIGRIESFQGEIEEDGFDSPGERCCTIATCICEMEALEQSGDSLPDESFLYSLEELREMLKVSLPR
jgi:hypothetical protein